MRCQYKDDFQVDYTGPVHITKGDTVDLTVTASEIPANIKQCLDSAVTRNSCHELRSAARALTTNITKAFNTE
jgi:hypothetical protein